MERLSVWLFVAPAWLWALLPLWAVSDGVADWLEMLGVVAFFVPVVFVWLAFFVVCLAWRRWDAWAMWLTVPIVWSVALVLSVTDVPMTVRVRLSESELRQYAESNDPSPPGYKNTKRIGSFRVEKVWRHERTVAFATGSKVFDIVGVIYAPDGFPTAPLPMETEELLSAQYTHLYGPWYRFEIGD